MPTLSQRPTSLLRCGSPSAGARDAGLLPASPGAVLGFESSCEPIASVPWSAEEHQPEQKREQRGQAGVNQNGPNDYNSLAQQQPSAGSGQENADDQAEQPGRKK